MTRAVSVLVVDTFTARPFGGNPAVVVPDAAGLDVAEMQQIAAELGRPGTAFVLPPTRPGGPVGLRMFTPIRELTYSGHTTLAAVHALAETRRLSASRVTCQTSVGPVEASLDDQAGAVTIWLERPPPRLLPWAGPLDAIMGGLGMGRAELADWAAPMLTEEQDLLLAVTSLEALQGLAPDAVRLGQTGRDLAIRGFCLVTLETVEPASLTHARFFAPHFGIPEDIVTGSAHRGVGAWLAGAGRLPADQARFTAEQGDGLGRPGRLQVAVSRTADGAIQTRVGGHAVTVLSGSLRLG